MNLFISKAIIPERVKQILNILFYRGYSGKLDFFLIDRKVAKPRTQILIRGSIKNNGIQGKLTTYIVIRIIDPYEPKKIIFNTDTDLAFDNKRNLIVYDIEKNEQKDFAFMWEVPENINKPTLYLKIDVWSPRKLYKKRNIFYYPYLFDTSGWKGFLEIIRNDNDMIKVFVSYSWVNEEHKAWVLSLSELLTKNGMEVIIDRDLLPGQEITKFMETGIKNADVILLICSEEFTRKANHRIGGAGFETTIGTKKYYYSTNKERFIPVVRNNNLEPSEKIPEFLGTTMYVDMDTDKWYGEPLQKLIQAIKKVR